MCKPWLLSTQVSSPWCHHCTPFYFGLQNSKRVWRIGMVNRCNLEVEASTLVYKPLQEALREKPCSKHVCQWIMVCRVWVKILYLGSKRCKSKLKLFKTAAPQVPLLSPWVRLPLSFSFFYSSPNALAYLWSFRKYFTCCLCIFI